jgi:hypothetical protein
MILHDFGVVDQATGMPISEAQLVSEAWGHGWLTQNGTQPEDMGQLLEYHGISTHSGNGIEDLMHELAEGHKVIVGVDSGELWETDGIFEDILHGEQADHVIVVKGIKLNEEGNPVVVVNDPGDILGAGREYPIDDFMNAFEDGGCRYIATDNAPPDFDPLEVSFSKELFPSYKNQGHSDDLEFDQYATLENSPENMTETEKDDILFDIDGSDIKNIAKAASRIIRSL